MSATDVDRLFAKLRDFVADLDDDERKLLAALLAPGVAQAYGPDAEVEGFAQDDPGVVGWSPSRLPESLRSFITDHDIRIEGI